MKKIILFAIIINSTLIFAQDWNHSESCNINAMDPDFENLPFRQGAINATLKLDLGSSGCSGTLINRNTSDYDIGYYILTARHCVDDLDFNNDVTVFFNYQSPNGDNLSTEVSNRGITFGQSISLSDNAHQYAHTTKLKLVSWFVWGDIALVEMLTPIPPHFNVTYAGWNPNKFGSTFTLDHLPTEFFGVHHPDGDIKKISGTNNISWLETPIATGCYTITTIIDVLFGWIWGNSVSTSVICNYVDNPWMTVSNWQYGITEGGSSGSGFFFSDNTLIGVLSGLDLENIIDPCDFSITTYGKFHANYSNKKIKNTLNPGNNVWVDLFGVGERRIESYRDLDLPGEVSGGTGHYFPASHYQEVNKISLVAENTISTTKPIKIYPGADYEFVAGESITIGAGFSAEAGCDFTARIATSGTLKSSTATPEQIAISKLQSIDLPIYKKFESEKYE